MNTFCLHFKIYKILRDNMQEKSQRKWYQRKERGSTFWLKISLFCVINMPNFLLKILIRIVTFVYFCVSKEERNNLKRFYKNLQDYANIKPQNPYKNFYAFGESICDKIAVWKGKITKNDLNIIDSNFIHKQLNFDDTKENKGQIILTSHFGNIEIARALASENGVMNIAVLMHKKNAVNFLNFINDISKNKLQVLYVEDFNIQSMMKIKEMIDNGVHIGIMGDRISINDSKNIRVKFLGKECFMPQGALILGHILKTKISMLWCEKKEGIYEVSLNPLNYDKNTNKIITYSKNKNENIEFLMQKYIKTLEQKVQQNPVMWFNFYDFWGK